MKRNKNSTRAMRNKLTAASGATGHRSQYARKVRGKNQMFGPGCCAHRLKVAGWSS